MTDPISVRLTASKARREIIIYDNGNGTYDAPPGVVLHHSSYGWPRVTLTGPWQVPGPTIVRFVKRKL